MAAAVKLRQDYDGPALRALAKRARDAGQSRRLLVLAAIYEGSSRGAAAQLGRKQRRTIREWVVNFNAHGLTPGIHGVVRWHLQDLAQWFRDEFGVRIDETTAGRELNRISFADRAHGRVIAARKRVTSGRSDATPAPGQGQG